MADDENHEDLDELDGDESPLAEGCEFGCSCSHDKDGLVVYVCAHHRMSYSAEYSLRATLDRELDESIRELFGDRKMERKEGVVFGTFPIARKA